MPDNRLITLFTSDSVLAARALLGARLCHGNSGGIIVETEAYRAEGDPACHTFFRKKAREFVAAHPAGTLYVYLNYGMHWMLNFLTKTAEDDIGFVLIRALQPTEGLAAMQTRRRQAKPEALCSGPGKLTAALGIDGRLHGASPAQLVIEPAASAPACFADGRIGISRATEFPWRFTAATAKPWVSRPPASNALKTPALRSI